MSNFTLKINILFAILIVSSITPLQCWSEDDGGSQHLFGDWDGKRSTWEEQGISIDSILTNDLIANVSGGRKETAGVLGNYDLTVALDTGKLGWWKNGTIFTYFLGNYGRNPTEYVGDLQASDNIEAYDTFKLYEGWYEHSFADGRFSVLLGLHDYNSEFDALDYSGTLINSSFGISPDISQVGPSIFSTTAMAARVKFQFSDNWYLLSAAYDGVPGNPNNPRGTHVNFKGSDGIFYAMETGLLAPENRRHYKAALGGWYHT